MHYSILLLLLGTITSMSAMQVEKKEAISVSLKMLFTCGFDSATTILSSCGDVHAQRLNDTIIIQDSIVRHKHAISDELLIEKSGIEFAADIKKYLPKDIDQHIASFCKDDDSAIKELYAQSYALYKSHENHAICIHHLVFNPLWGNVFFAYATEKGAYCVATFDIQKGEKDDKFSSSSITPLRALALDASKNILLWSKDGVIGSIDVTDNTHISKRDVIDKSVTNICVNNREQYAICRTSDGKALRWGYADTNVANLYSVTKLSVTKSLDFAYNFQDKMCYFLNDKNIVYCHDMTYYKDSVKIDISDISDLFCRLKWDSITGMLLVRGKESLLFLDPNTAKRYVIPGGMDYHKRALCLDIDAKTGMIGTSTGASYTFIKPQFDYKETIKYPFTVQDYMQLTSTVDSQKRILCGH